MWFPPVRFYICVMIFFTTFTNYMFKTNLSVSIIQMNKAPDKGNVSVKPACEFEKKAKKNITLIDPQYSWSENQESSVMVGYFYGYLVTVIPGGLLAELIGPWHVILWSSVLTSILNALMPISCTLGFEAAVANRVFTGFAAGLGYPAVNVLIAKWAPPKEKGKFMAAMMGNTLGTVVTFSMVGAISEKFGWYWGFYACSIFMGVFCIAFALIVSDSPNSHRLISDAERDYILEAQGGTVSAKKKVAPYKKIFLSWPFWVMTIAQFGNLWAMNLVITYAPKFLSETLGFDLKGSGFLAALPYLARLILSFVFGALGDWMRKKEIMSLTKLRRFFIIFSHIIPAFTFGGMIAAQCESAVSVSMLVLNQGLNGAVCVSHLVSPQDLAPNFAGTVYGLMNFIGGLTGIFVPQITGLIKDEYDVSTFTAPTIIFSLGATALMLCGLLFIFCSTSEVQPWNEIKEDT